MKHASFEPNSGHVGSPNQAVNSFAIASGMILDADGNFVGEVNSTINPDPTDTSKYSGWLYVAGVFPGRGWSYMNVAVTKAEFTGSPLAAVGHGSLKIAKVDHTLDFTIADGKISWSLKNATAVVWAQDPVAITGGQVYIQV